MNRPAQDQGFTIVETLVAIAVLMIAIAGPLSIANKGLTAALAARDQMIASYLVQESMEVVKNIRDNNIFLGVNWLDGGAYALSGCTYSAPCDASAIDLAPIMQCGSLAACKASPLKTASGGYYSHAGSGAATLFTRYFYISQPGSTAACSSGIECTLTVNVEWNEGTLPYQVSISNQLLNTSR